MASERIGKDKLFIIGSFIFIGFMILFYGGRFLYFYYETHKTTETGVTLLSTVITTVREGSGISIEKDGKYFKGEQLTNYVHYSGWLWRIISVNNNGTIKLVLDESSASINFGEKYENSYVRNWLNKTEEEFTGVFFNALYEPENFLAKTETCVDVVSTIESINECANKVIDYVGLLSIHDYIKTNDTNNFLNNDTYYWLSNSTNENEIWFVNGNNKLSHTSSIANYGVKPTITLKSGLVYIGGSGTKLDPYYVSEKEMQKSIEEENQEDLNYSILDISVGDYISFNDMLFKVLDKSDDKVKIVSMDLLRNDNQIIEKQFSDKNNVYDLKNSKSIAYYLNNTYYNSIINKDYLVKGIFYIGDYIGDYKSVYNDSIEAYIGLLNIADIYLNELKSTFTITRNGEISKTIYSILDDGRLYSDLYNSKNAIRPVMFLKGSLSIINGYGTKGSPYKIGEV